MAEVVASLHRVVADAAAVGGFRRADLFEGLFGFWDLYTSYDGLQGFYNGFIVLGFEACQTSSSV